MNSELEGQSRQSIYGQLVRLLFLFAFVPLLIVSSINYFRAAGEVERFINEDMVISTLDKKAHFESWFSLRVSELNLLSRSRRVNEC